MGLLGFWGLPLMKNQYTSAIMPRIKRIIFLFPSADSWAFSFGLISFLPSWFVTPYAFCETAFLNGISSLLTFSECSYSQTVSGKIACLTTYSTNFSPVTSSKENELDFDYQFIFQVVYMTGITGGLGLGVWEMSLLTQWSSICRILVLPYIAIGVLVCGYFGGVIVRVCLVGVTTPPPFFLALSTLILFLSTQTVYFNSYPSAIPQLLSNLNVSPLPLKNIPTSSPTCQVTLPTSLSSPLCTSSTNNMSSTLAGRFTLKQYTMNSRPAELKFTVLFCIGSGLVDSMGCWPVVRDLWYLLLGWF